MLRRTSVPLITFGKCSLGIWINPRFSTAIRRRRHTSIVAHEFDRYVPPARHAASWVPRRRLHRTDRLLANEVVKAPTFPEAIAQGTAKYVKKEGESVNVDDVVMEIETDKLALPVPSPVTGRLAKFLVKEGDVVTAYKPLFEIEVGVAGTPSAGAAPAAAAPAAAPAAAAAGRVAPAPPFALARGTPAPAPAVVTPSGPTDAATRIFDPSRMISGSRENFTVEMSKMRLKIAERLKHAQNTCAMLTTFNECDMGNLMAFRKKNLENFKTKYGVKLSFMSPFLKAAANALVDQPVVNGYIEGTKIIYRDYVDISVAVATPRGLVVPVIRNVESMDYPKIELTLNHLGQKARSGTLAMAEMQGGTFTISNGGVFGSLMSMPIINMPQSAILGMHAIQMRPVAVGKKIKIRPMMYLALSYDHRLIDGREAVLFLRKIKSGVENPTSILAGI